MYHIQETAKISGVSVRTLHYYDQIGLLSPEKSANGYRLYTEENIDQLQQILFYKFLGFPLKQIKYLLSQKEQTQRSTLEKQLALLKQEECRIQQLIDTLEKTIQYLEGERTMSPVEKFKGFQLEDHQAYREEAIEKYGKEVIVASEKRQQGKEETMLQIMNDLFFAFADHNAKGIAIDNPSTLTLAKKLHETLCTYAFDCSLEVFEKIGKGYVADARFKENIDQFGEGTAQYISDAIAKYVLQ